MPLVSFLRSCYEEYEGPFDNLNLVFLGYANITLKEVLAQKVMAMFDYGQRPRVTATTFFAPRCKFPRPYRGILFRSCTFISPMC